jgi:hypothetical protein
MNAETVPVWILRIEECLTEYLTVSTIEHIVTMTDFIRNDFGNVLIV